MKPYDPNKVYLGPNGHWLKRFIPKFPPECEILHPYWNRAAYKHDEGYEGDEYAGFFGWLKKAFNRQKVEAERYIVDKYFHEELKSSIEQVKSELSDKQIILAETYAGLVFKAVHTCGWSFYKTGGVEE